MAIDKLWLYNEALRVCRARPIVSLTDTAEGRHLLDNVYGGNSIFLQSVLEEGQWAFAMRTSKVEYDPSVEPSFGYRFAFPKPTDWVRTSYLCTDEYFTTPLNQTRDEIGYWFADLQTIYVQYVSSDPAFGGNLALWTPSFALYAGCWLAKQIIPRLKNSKTSVDDVDKELEIRLRTALSKNAMNQPTKFMPPGSLVGARLGRGNPRQSLWNGSYTSG